MENKGVLYVCATPIGNLEDITLRVLNVLRGVSLICAEDTRRTIKLLNRYEIGTPMTSFHEHSEREKSAIILEKLLNGENIALVSDAGLPSISDPGAHLIKLCRSHGVGVTVCPGATAAVTAFVLAGFTGEYAFYGFLPRNKKERAAAVRRAAFETRPAILYEAPHRLIKTLHELKLAIEEADRRPDSRNITICRELTKAFEEVTEAAASQHIARYEQNPPKGEFVLIIEARPPDLEENKCPENVREHVDSLMVGGLSKSAAIKAAAKQLGVGKREVYAAIMRKEYIDKVYTDMVYTDMDYTD